jgi:hypothetical protein
MIYEDRLPSSSWSFDYREVALKLFIMTNDQCREAVVTWILIAKRYKVARDVYLMIGKMIWDKRDDEWGEKGDEEEDGGRKKLKI